MQKLSHFSVKVVDDEITDHFDIIFFYDCEKSHYVYISNFSRFIKPHMILNGHTFIYTFTFIRAHNVFYRLISKI